MESPTTGCMMSSTGAWTSLWPCISCCQLYMWCCSISGMLFAVRAIALCHNNGMWLLRTMRSTVAECTMLTRTASHLFVVQGERCLYTDRQNSTACCAWQQRLEHSEHTYCRFVVAMARNSLGGKCGSHILCPSCYQRHSHQAAVQAQKSEPPVLSPKHLKKQSSGVGWHAPGLSSLSPLHVIAGDTRYSGQQILTSGRTVLSPTGASTDNLVMELSRRGSAPR